MALEKVIGDFKMHPPIWFDDILVSPFPRRNPLKSKPENYVWMRKIRTGISKEQICVLYLRKGQTEHFHYTISETARANKKYNECFLILRADDWICSANPSG